MYTVGGEGEIGKIIVLSDVENESYVSIESKIQQIRFLCIIRKERGGWAINNTRS